MAGFAPYPHYKDSGLPWIGRIPAHWERRRISNLGKVGNGSTPSRENLAYWSDTGTPWLNSGAVHQGIIQIAPRHVTPLAVAQCHLPLVSKNSIVIAITGQGKTRGTSAVLGMDATINQHLAYISVRNNVANSFFLRFVLTAAYGVLRAISDDVGGTKGALTCAAVKRFPVPLPPLAEQEKIAHYLRTQDTKIARFIRIKRALIERLKEQKLRLIDHAVTGGLDAASECWESRRLKDVAKIIAGQSPDSAYVVDTPDGLPFLQGSAEFGDIYPSSKSFCIRAPKIAPENSWLLSVRAPVGSINFANQPYCIGRGLAAICPLNPDALCNDFLGYCLKHKQLFLMAISTGSIFQAISSYQIKNLEIKLPPIEIQKKIARFLNGKIAEISAAITQSEQEITLIREYRERLIADAVTGQIDLRGWQPSADDMTFEDDSLAALADEDAPDAQEDARDEDE